MSFALFVGCKIPGAVPEYERSSRAVLRELGVAVEDAEFGCCGYPSRHLRLDAHVVLAARNLAIAGARGLDLLTLCQCCYGSLRSAQYLLRRDERLRAAVGEALAREGLKLPDAIEVRHLLDVLDKDVGADAIAKRVKVPQRGKKVAAHYGCHALRPSDVVALDNPQAPTIFERLVAATGAEPVEWPRRLECCGAPIAKTNAPLASRMRASKIADARESGAEWLCTACPYCQLELSGAERLPALLYPQLLGLALGIEASALGLTS